MVEPQAGIQVNAPEPIEQVIFPLPLSPLEKYLFWDDRPDQPMTSYVELEFVGSLNVDLWRQACREILAHHPLLQANVVERNGELYWIPANEIFHILDPEVTPILQNGCPRPIDLNRESGLRCWYCTTQDGGRVIFQLHHCCSDGIGFRGFLIDVLRWYAMSSECNSAELLRDSGSRKTSFLYERLVPRLLQQRFDFTHVGPAKSPLTTWQRIKNAHYFHFQPPVSLLGSMPKADCNDAESIDPLCHLNLGRELSDQLMAHCQSQSIGLSELSIALLFKTCVSWNAAKGLKHPNSRLRILVPYDLRGRQDLAMPASNRLTFAFLGRTAAQCGDVQSLCDSIQQEFVAFKDTRLGMDFLDGLRLANQHPRLMRWTIGRSHRMATVVVTYAGELARGMSKLFPQSDGVRLVGNVRLTAIHAAPPVRRNTNVSIAICVNWGEIMISAAFNHTAFSRLDCKAFLELYHQQWRDYIATR